MQRRKLPRSTVDAHVLSVLNALAAVVLRRAIGLGLFVCPPCFYLISSPSSGGERTVQVFIGSLVLAGGLGMYVGPLTWWMASQLPDVQTRNTAIGISYNVAAMVRKQLAMIHCINLSEQSLSHWLGLCGR
jgi:hypothetical protein